jgi:hypothetical protein
MPGVSMGFAEVEGRVRALQRRLNWLTVQHAFYVSATLVTLATALIIALALRGRAGWFAVALWAGLGTATASVVLAGLRIRRQWLSLAQVAHLADRRARLDDRLLTALSIRERRAPLAVLLLDQLGATAPRWDVAALAPRRVPRSVFALPLALAALIATAFYARPPAPPVAPPPVLASSSLNEAGLFEPAPTVPQAGTDANGAQTAASTSPHRGLPSAHGQDTPPRGAAGEMAGIRTGGLGGAKGTRRRDDHANSGTHSDQVTADDTRMSTSTVQEAIRRAFGADDAANRKPAAGPPPPSAGTAGARDSERSHTAPSSPAPGSRDATRPQQGGRPTRDGLPPGGAGTGSSPEGLYASEPTAVGVTGESRALPIKLGAFATLASNQQEPQRPGAVPEVGRPAPHDSSSVPLTDDQMPDAALQKADIAPQHEAAVLRIFTRDE